MSVKRRKAMSDFEFYQTQYLGGRVSQKEPFYKTMAMKEGDRAFAQWFIENSERLSSLTTEEALIEILDAKSKIEYLKGMTEVSHLAMKLGDTTKRKDARDVREILKRARAGIKTT